MAILHRKPEGLNLSGNLKDFELTSNEPISFKLYRGYNLLLDLVYPESTKSSVKIDIQKIVESHLSYTFNTSERIYEQTSIYADFIAEIDGVKHTFRVIRCGISNYSAPAHDFLGRCFLTWQPVEKKVTYYSPEWLTYYALESCSINITVTFEDKSQSTKVIVNCLAKKAYTIDMQYGVVMGLFGGKPIAYYEVYVKLNDVIISEVQRYIYSEELSISESWIVWENSLGGLDTARVYGSSKKISEHTHNTAIVGKQDITYDIDTLRSVEKNTGYLNTYERKWMKDFFPATKKYIYSDASILPIIVTKDNVSFIADDTLSSYSFSYQFAKQNKYLNINKQHISMPQQISLPVPDRPGYLESPKLVEFPRINISDGVMLAVQQPHTDSYSSTTIGAVKEYLLDALQQPESKHKGFFNTSSGLISAYPNPTVGDNAWIGSVYPGVVYDCVTRGVWRATATVPPAGNVTLADYPKKSEMLIVSETNPTTPPTLNGQFHYNKTENRMFVAASGNASPLTQQVEGRSLLGTAPASWKIRYDQDSGKVSHFEQDGSPLLRDSEEPVTDSNELEVVYYGEMPEDRAGYDKTLFYGVEPNDAEVATLEMKFPSLYATYAVAGWHEIASTDYVNDSNVVMDGKQWSYALAFRNIKNKRLNAITSFEYDKGITRLMKYTGADLETVNWENPVNWIPIERSLIVNNTEVTGRIFTGVDGRNVDRPYKAIGLTVIYSLEGVWKRERYIGDETIFDDVDEFIQNKYWVDDIVYKKPQGDNLSKDNTCYDDFILPLKAVEVREFNKTISFKRKGIASNPDSHFSLVYKGNTLTDEDWLKLECWEHISPCDNLIAGAAGYDWKGDIGSARNSIPFQFRKMGLEIRYISNSVWISERYIGSLADLYINGFYSAKNWESLTSTNKQVIAIAEKSITDNEIKLYDIDDYPYIISDNLYAINGVSQQIYRESIINKNALNEFYSSEQSFVSSNEDTLESIVTTYKNDFTFNGSVLGSKARFCFKNKYVVHPYWGREVKCFSVSKDTLTGKTPKILNIGDSITNREVPSNVFKFLSLLGCSPTMLGTMTNLGGKQGEGRENWTITNLIGQENMWGSPYDNKSITPLLIGTSGTVYQNPFLKLADENDKVSNPTFCYRSTGSIDELNYNTDPIKTGEFYIFDFKKYVEVNLSGVMPDVMTLAFGTNDSNKSYKKHYEANPSPELMCNRYTRALDFVLGNINAYYPSLKIGVMPMYSRFDNYMWTLGSYATELIKSVIANIRTKNLESINVVGVWMYINRYYTNNNPNHTTIVDDNQLTAEFRVTDTLHYDGVGRAQLSTAIGCYIANMI